MPIAARRLSCAHVANILSVDQDAAGGHVVEAEEQPRDRRFARARRPDDRDLGVRRDLEADPLQDLRDRLVGEMHVLEADRAVPDRKRRCARPIRHFRRNREQLEHRLDVGEALHDLAIDEADEVQRQRKLHQERVDQHEIADRLLAAHDGARRHHHADRHAGAEDRAPARGSAPRATSRS